MSPVNKFLSEANALNISTNLWNPSETQPDLLKHKIAAFISAHCIVYFQTASSTRKGFDKLLGLGLGLG